MIGCGVLGGTDCEEIQKLRLCGDTKAKAVWRNE
jgi:hypothetical protein